MPWLVHWALVGPKIRRFDRRYMQPLQRVISGSDCAADRKGVRDSAKDLMSKQVSSCASQILDPESAATRPEQRQWLPVRTHRYAGLSITSCLDSPMDSTVPPADQYSADHSTRWCTGLIAQYGLTDGVANAGQQAGAGRQQHAAAGGARLHGVMWLVQGDGQRVGIGWDRRCVAAGSTDPRLSRRTAGC